MGDGETRGLVTCPCGWSKVGYFRDLRDHQDTHRQQVAQEERFAIVEAAVRAIVPNVQNETAAWNTWNNLASREEFRRAIVMIDRERRWAEHDTTDSGPQSGCDPEPWLYYDGTRRPECPYPEGSENPYRVLWKYEPRPEYAPCHEPTGQEQR